MSLSKPSNICEDPHNYHTNGWMTLFHLGLTVDITNFPCVFKCRNFNGIESFYVKVIGWFCHNRLWLQCVRPDDERFHASWGDDEVTFYFMPATQVQAYYYQKDLPRVFRKYFWFI